MRMNRNRDSDRSMRRVAVTRWAIRVAMGIGALAILALVYVLASSEWLLRRQHDIPLEPLPPVASPDSAEGERLAVIVGCWAGCHGLRGEGEVLEGGGAFRVTAPTLSSVLAEYTDEELVRLIRYGVKRDGRTAIGMVPRTFYPISDHDLALIVAHLRSVPPAPAIPRERRVTLLGRTALATGLWKTAADEVDRTRPRWGALPRRTPFERGRYLASITCSECHGVDFQGNELEGGPPLIVIARYDSAQFRHLLRTGEPIDGRDLGMMSWVSRNAFSRFTDEEIQDVHVFLRESFGLAP